MIYQREIYKKVIQFLNDKEIIVIHGSRQVGKTSLMKYIIQNDEKVRRNYFYMDLEEPEFLSLCNAGENNLVEYLKIHNILKNERLYLFIDEIQYLENPSSFLKLLFDKHNEEIKIIVSGSSTFAIKTKFKVSLVGRTINFELFPLSFREYLIFKNINIDLTKKIELDIVISELKKHFANFIKAGGYPGIVLEESFEKKKTKLNQLITTYVKADIRDIGQIRNIGKFNKLLEVLASQIGKLVNISELSNSIGIARQTIEEYLFILENTYLIKLVRPYSTNIRTEVTKMPKIFFEDTGVANLFRKHTLDIELDGQIFENAVFSELRKYFSNEQLYFLRSTKNHEIDFILRFDNRIIPIESKLTCMDQKLTSVNYFKEKGYFNTAYFCRLNGIDKSKIGWLNLIYPWELNAEILNSSNF